jgi:hypothetical protein
MIQLICLIWIGFVVYCVTVSNPKCICDVIQDSAAISTALDIAAKLALMLLFCSSVALCNSYSTTFPLTENPISEAGNWTNGGTVGLNWNNCRTTTNFAFGTQPGTSNYDDSTCTLNGTWGPNQTAQMTIHVLSTTNSDWAEAEIRLNTTVTAKSITGYEINCSVKPSGSGGGPYVQIVRWNGSLGSFTELNGTSSTGCANGDILKATISGGVITAYKNGAAVLTANDSTYTSGKPGMGFYIQNVDTTTAAADSAFGASAFSATDGLTTTGSSATPAGLSCAPTSLSSGASSTCTVTLNQAAPTGGASVTLSSTNTALTVPASVSVAAGSTSATVTAKAGTVSSSQSAVVTATLNSVSKTATVFLVASGTTTAPAYVQGNSATPQTPQSTVTATYNAAQVAGDLNVVVVGWNDSTAVVSTISDLKGNVYTRAVGPTIQSGYASQSIYYAKNIASAAAGANRVTVTFTSAARYPDIRVLEYSGADPSNPVDVTLASSGTSASSSSGSVTTTNATDLILGSNLVQTVATGPGSSFTQRMLTQDGDIAEDKMVTAVGSYSASSPLSPSAPWIMQLVAFRTAPGSGTTATGTTPATLTCSSTTITGAGTDSCTVTLNSAAVSSGVSVNLSSSNAMVTVPATVTVAANATSAVFTAKVSSCSSAQTVTLSASASSVTKSIALQLKAAASTLSINASSVAFGDVTVNTAVTQSVILTSTGAVAVTVNAPAITGTGFTLAGGTRAITLNPGQTATLNVQFDPSAAGTATGQLTITSNSSTNGTVVLGLSGTGESYAVDLSWDAPSSSTDPVAGYNVYRALSGTTAYQQLNSSADTQVAFVDSTVQAGLTYDYMIESVDASGVKSVASNIAAVTIP